MASSREVVELDFSYSCLKEWVEYQGEKITINRWDWLISKGLKPNEIRGRLGIDGDNNSD